MDYWHLLTLLVAGVGVGFINTLAGGGTLVTIPLMMLLGMPIQVANGTNRIGILLQNFSSFFSFRAKGIKVHYRLTFLLAVTTSIGAIFGAFFAARVGANVLKWVVVALMVVMLGLIFFKPKRWIKQKSLVPVRLRGWDYPIFFAIGFYGGFIQAGAGLIVTMALILRIGFDAVSAEAVKSLIMISYTIFAVVVFILHGQVDYLMGFALAAGSMVGAWLATRYAVMYGPRAIRLMMVLVMILATIYLIFFEK